MKCNLCNDTGIVDTEINGTVFPTACVCTKEEPKKGEVTVILGDKEVGTAVNFKTKKNKMRIWDSVMMT